MRYDAALGTLAAAGLTLNLGAMALGHCAMVMPPEDHRDHRAMRHEAPAPDERPDEDGMKGCHACLRKRALPIRG